MNPSIIQLLLKGMDQDQSVSQGTSKTKKVTSGKHNLSGLSDLISGEGSFASLLKQKYMSSTIKKDKTVKEAVESAEVKSTTGKGEIKKDLPDIKNGKVLLSPKETKEMEGVKGESAGIQFSGKVQDEKDVKRDPAILSLAGVYIKHDPGILLPAGMDEKVNGKIPVVEFGKSQPLNGSEKIDKETNSKLNLQEEIQVKGGSAGRSQFVTDKEAEFSVKKGISGFHRLEKDTKLSEGEAINDSGVQTAGGLKDDKPVRRNVSGELKISQSGNTAEDHKNDQDILKGFDVKESSVNKGSSDLNGKEREVLSSKGGAQQSEGGKEDVIPTNQARPESEKTQIYKNIISDAVKPERLIDKVVNELPGKKLDTSPLTTQVDFSGVKGIWNITDTNIKNGIITPINFQDVANQITAGAMDMIKKDSGRIVITLEPPNLGTLNMDVRVQHDTVKMVLVADNYEVKQVLNSNLDQLKTALQGQGLNIDRLDVLVQDRSYEGNQGFHPGGGALFNDGRGGRNNTKEDTPFLQTLPSGVNELSEPYLGIISLFV